MVTFGIELIESAEVIDVSKISFRDVSYRSLADLLYQRAMQFGKGSEAAKVLPKRDTQVFRANKRKLGEEARKSASTLHKLMLDHLREALDFDSFYSMPKPIFDQFPKQELYLGQGCQFLSSHLLFLSNCLFVRVLASLLTRVPVGSSIIHLCLPSCQQLNLDCLKCFQVVLRHLALTSGVKPTSTTGAAASSSSSSSHVVGTVPPARSKSVLQFQTLEDMGFNDWQAATDTGCDDDCLIMDQLAMPRPTSADGCGDDDRGREPQLCVFKLAHKNPSALKRPLSCVDSLQSDDVAIRLYEVVRSEPRLQSL